MRHFSSARAILPLLTAAAVFGWSPARADQPSLADARHLLLTGKYAEAAEAYENLAETEPVAAAVGLAACRTAVGDYDKAAAALLAIAEEHPDAAELWAARAQLAFDSGDHAKANELVAAALEQDADNVHALWLRAELARTSGKLDDADKQYHVLVEYYNAHDVQDPDALRWIGLAAAQYARWHHLADQFGFLVNELYSDTLELEEAYWLAHYETGRLFLEKFNEADASRELKAALQINPEAAPVYAALGELALQNYDLDQARQAVERALEINPRLLAARLLEADLKMANFEIEEAIELLAEVRKLNPVSESTLARLAAAYIALDGMPEDPAGSRLGELLAEVNERNPHAGEFYYMAAVRLEERRKFDAAERMFREAIGRMPQQVGPRAGLGMMFMRLGEEEEAQKLLDESFEIDPFNVRVSNMLKVLEVLDEYETLETEHFIIKFDSSDRLLADYAGRRLEEAYPELCRWLDFEPPEKSLFEFFNKFRNTNGHGWFSARMVGLPYIGTVGACAGKMVAMASPNDMRQKFNWARVLKHEFVHVINLQQTNYNIPHWFTEALAVWSEGYPRPQEWSELLARRAADGELFNLDDINFGFIRPSSSADWTLAYCQAELYAEYIIETYGEEAIGRMLAAYADNLDTRATLKRALSVEQEELEKGYRAYLDKIVSGLKVADREVPMRFSELVRAQAQQPDDVDLTARLAYAYLRRESYPRARQMAQQVLKTAPKHQLATYVMARLHVLVGDAGRAIEVLSEVLDEENPQANALALLAGLKLREKDYDEAARLYELAARHNPHEQRWPKALARVYLLSGDDDSLQGVLEQLAEIDADDVVIRKKLGQLALAAGRVEEAIRWANQSLDVDVMDPDVHQMLAEAYLAAEKYHEAIFEYRAAIEIDPEDAKLRMALAQGCLDAGDRAGARKTLEALLLLEPDHAEAARLLETIEP